VLLYTISCTHVCKCVWSDRALTG